GILQVLQALAFGAVDVQVRADGGKIFDLQCFAQVDLKIFAVDFHLRLCSAAGVNPEVRLLFGCKHAEVGSNADGWLLQAKGDPLGNLGNLTVLYEDGALIAGLVSFGVRSNCVFTDRQLIESERSVGLHPDTALDLLLATWTLGEDVDFPVPH